MKKFLRLSFNMLASRESASTLTPRHKLVDWPMEGGPVEVADASMTTHTIAPSQEVTLFDGTRTLAMANDTEMSVELVEGTTDRYRFRWTGGTNPAFRVGRGLNLSGATIVVTVNANGTAVMSVTAGSFAGVQVGDTVWVPDDDESPDQPFHEVNRGFWTVLTATADALTLSRGTESFTAKAETVVLDDAGQLVAFSSSGVQFGDTLAVLDGFTDSTLRTFPIAVVTSTYLEVQSSLAIAEETDVIPSADGLVVFSDAKRFLYIESSGRAVVRANGDTGDSQKLEPLSEIPGFYARNGVTWACSVENVSDVSIEIVLVTAE